MRLSRCAGRRQPPAAECGELRFFVGGDPQTYEATRPALSAVGAKMDLLGPLGAGATWKLINNQLAAGQIAALAEALEVAKKAGFRDEQISELILGGAPASPIVKLKLPRMLARDFEPTDFALNLMLKDARYAAALAQSLGAPAGMIEGAARRSRARTPRGWAPRTSPLWSAERRIASMRAGGNEPRPDGERWPHGMPNGATRLTSFLSKATSAGRKAKGA